MGVLLSDKEKRKGRRMQSAMEYLTTYGWMIIVIIVAVTALFALGVFNLQSYSPKASSGTCFVSRPNGPNTTAFIALDGGCDNLLPRYAMSTRAPFVLTCNPGTVPIRINMTIARLNALTLSWWSSTSNPNASGTIVHLDSSNAGGVSCVGNLCTVAGSSVSPAPAMLSSGWIYYALTMDNSGKSVLYIDGKPGPTGGGTSPLTSVDYMTIGAYSSACAKDFNGSIANVQLYNSSLDANTINTMYYYGIGADPIFVNNLVGWWQLNGDVQDWSGDMNNGATTNVIFNTQWYTNYVPP
ncbi:MAG: hypothetical protein KGH72_04290 [Candidatus Micrarchaeota archaeon]|nr:hypothetical protein [Candidatus Micrarchaeota archaeon]